MTKLLSRVQAPRLSRRTLLRGSLAAGVTSCVGLPLLESMLNNNGTALAQGGALPKRLGVFFWGNGVHPERLKPLTAGANWTPSEQLMPLAGLTDTVSVVSGMDNWTAGTDGHEAGAGILTGHHASMLSTSPKNIAPTHESFDQLAGRTIGKQTQFQSLQLRISKATVRQGILYDYTSWSSATSPIEPERDPLQLYSRIFAGFEPDAQAMPMEDQTLGLRRSALDVVRQDLEALRLSVGTQDQARLDEHLTHLRAVENRLSAFTEPGPNCEEPGLPTMPEDSNPQRQELLAPRVKVMSDLLGAALACDLTRVFAFQLTGSVAITRYPIEGFDQDHHQLTHDEPGEQPLVHQATLYNMEQFATFVRTLDGITEGTGTLLDSCAILAASDCAEGRSHAQKDLPLMVAGTAGGKLKRGVHISAPGENTNKLVFSLLNAVGCQITEFGEQSDRFQARATEGLSAIEA